MNSQVPDDNAIDFDLKKRLLDKSIEAYVLALETINRLTIQYRCETFCYLFCNAWELLLKSKILADAGIEDAIFYKQKQGQPKRSLSLRNCLKRVMQNENDPARRNIERIEELRDEAVHLVISQIPADVIRLFQAGVINYHKRLNEWFGESLSDRYPVGMMSIVYDMSPERQDMSDQRLQRELGIDAFEFLSKYCADIRREAESLDGATEYSIGIGYRLAFTKRKDDADIVLVSGTADGEPTQVVEVAKDPSKTHPFRQKEVIEQFNSRVVELSINQYDIQSVIKVYGIKSRQEYFYQGAVPGSPSQYSKAFVDWLVRQHEVDEQFFCKARDKNRATKSTIRSKSVAI